MAMLAFVALLSEGPHGPADPRQNPREDPALLVPSDRFVQAPQGNVIIWGILGTDGRRGH